MQIDLYVSFEIQLILHGILIRWKPKPRNAYILNKNQQKPAGTCMLIPVWIGGVVYLHALIAAQICMYLWIIIKLLVIWLSLHLGTKHICESHIQATITEHLKKKKKFHLKHIKIHTKMIIYHWKVKTLIIDSLMLTVNILQVPIEQHKTR